MDTSEWIAIIAGVVALAVSIIVWHRSNQPLTLQGVTEIARDTAALAVDLQEVANVAVASAQQLKESGKIDSNAQAFQHAVNHIESWYNTLMPDAQLEPRVVANAVEAAYRALKLGDKLIRAQVANSQQPRSEADLLNDWLQEPNNFPSNPAMGAGLEGGSTGTSEV